MKNISNLTDKQLEQEIENTKSVAEIINDREIYKRELNLEQLKRLKMKIK